MTNTVLLRDVVEGDLPILFEYQRDPVAIRLVAFASREWEAFFAHWAKIRNDPAVLTKTVLFEGQVAGDIVSFGNADHREVGYWLGREFWGKGVASQALAAFLTLETARPLFAHVAKRNPASIRVLEKCGFVVVGEDPEFFRDGDEVVEGIILKLA